MEFVSFDLAKKLKEKGFVCDLPFAMYNELGQFALLTTSAPIRKAESGYTYRDYYDYDDFDEYDFIAPTIAQVSKWFRDEKNIYCLPWFVQGVDMWFYAICKPFYGCEFPDFLSKSDYYTYEQAAIAGIKYVLENLI
jgi:hypothetical protein